MERNSPSAGNIAHALKFPGPRLIFIAFLCERGDCGIISHMKKTAFILIALSLAVVGCRRTDVREFTVKLPTATIADQSAISAALAAYGGIDKSSMKFDPQSKTLKLNYDSMQLAKRNIEISIARAGFVANDVTPESVGAKPKAK